jgi:hypothetical protein
MTEPNEEPLKGTWPDERKKMADFLQGRRRRLAPTEPLEFEATREAPNHLIQGGDLERGHRKVEELPGELADDPRESAS